MIEVIVELVILCYLLLYYYTNSVLLFQAASQFCSDYTLCMTSSMGVITLVCLTLALLVVTLCYPDQIYVDSQTGVNSSSCWEGGYSTPCLYLNLALTGAQHHYNHSTTIILQPGQHKLNSGSDTQLRNMSQLTIVGNGSQGEVVIRCEPSAGLAFFWSEDIELKKISVVECGATQKIIIKRGVNTILYYHIQVAVFFHHCKMTKLFNVHITSSNGTGAFVYNPVSVVNITSCMFSLSGDQLGGGLVIFEKISNLHCTITNSTFTRNTAIDKAGGGISVVFSGKAAYNIVQLDGVHIIENNNSGIFIAFKDTAHGNEVIINDAEVIENTGSSGGGVFIASKDYESPSENIVIINSTRFISNVANIGGGITVEANSYLFFDQILSGASKLHIENCAFDNNYAVRGSILYQNNVFDYSMKIQNSTIIPWHSIAVNYILTSSLLMSACGKAGLCSYFCSWYHYGL